jgi:hypothetical protein
MNRNDGSGSGITGSLHCGLETARHHYGKLETPIIPIIIGDSGKTMMAGKRLFEYGIYATAIRPPTVAENTARIRMTVSSAHSENDIDASLTVLNRSKRKVSSHDTRPDETGRHRHRHLAGWAELLPCGLARRVTGLW